MSKTFVTPIIRRITSQSLIRYSLIHHTVSSPKDFYFEEGDDKSETIGQHVRDDEVGSG
jgi:hypothetical protein